MKIIRTYTETIGFYVILHGNNKPHPSFSTTAFERDDSEN